MDEITSITGRTFTPIGSTSGGRRQFFGLLAMFSGVLQGLTHHDELEVVFYVISLVGIAVAGLVRRDGSRMTPAQTRWFALWVFSATLVLLPYVPGAPDIGVARLVGLTLSPIAFIAIVVLSRRRVA